MHALDREQESVVWDLWSGLHPLMQAGFVPNKSYEDYKRELLKPRIKYSEKSFEEIEAEALAVIAAYEGR